MLVGWLVGKFGKLFVGGGFGASRAGVVCGICNCVLENACAFAVAF